MLGFLLPLLPTLFSSVVSAWGGANKNTADRVIEDRKALRDERVKAGEIIIAEQGWWFSALPRPLIALAFCIFIWKVVVWDVVLGLGVTDPLSAEMYSVMQAVIYAYFGFRTVEKVTAIIASRRK